MTIAPSHILCALLTAAVTFGALTSAHAQARLEARYTASLLGLPLAKGGWTVDVSGNDFHTSANAKTSGVVQVIAKGEGAGSGKGTLAGAAPVNTNFAATLKTQKKDEAVQMAVLGGAVKNLDVQPEPTPDPERTPVTEDQRKGILDPFAAVIVRVPGQGDPLSPQACPRKLPVFDGRMRFDLQLTFKRMDSVKADKGYAGPVVVCAMQFVPVGGFVERRAGVKYLASSRDIEVWLAPIAGTRVLVPFRAQMPTPLGMAALEATEFVVTPQPSSAAAGAPRAR